MALLNLYTARERKDQSISNGVLAVIMKKSELVRKTLKASQAELSDRCRNREALTIETSADELDRIQHAQERDFAMGVLDRESVRLREVGAYR